MAKLERTVTGEGFESLSGRIRSGIMDGSFREGAVRCEVMVFERYSWTGGNRLSMTVTLFQYESGKIRVSGITSGGSQAVFLKLNTLGEEAFLDELAGILGGR